MISKSHATPTDPSVKRGFAITKIKIPLPSDIAADKKLCVEACRVVELGLFDHGKVWVSRSGHAVKLMMPSVVSEEAPLNTARRTVDLLKLLLEDLGLEPEQALTICQRVCVPPKEPTVHIDPSGEHVSSFQRRPNYTFALRAIDLIYLSPDEISENQYAQYHQALCEVAELLSRKRHVKAARTLLERLPDASYLHACELLRSEKLGKGPEWDLGLEEEHAIGFLSRLCLADVRILVAYVPQLLEGKELELKKSEKTALCNALLQTRRMADRASRYLPTGPAARLSVFFKAMREEAKKQKED